MKKCLDNDILMYMYKRMIVTLCIALFLYVGMFFVTQDQSNQYAITFSGIKKLNSLFFTNDKKSTLIVPKFTQTLQSRKQEKRLYNNHWQGDRGFFVLIGEKIQSYEDPSVTTKSYKELFPMQRVRILFEKVKDGDIEGELRRWVFIASESGKEYLGWVFKDQLVFPEDFSRVSASDLGTFYYKKGEFESVISVSSSGYFSQEWESKGDGLFLSGNDQGHIYEYENFIWAKKGSQDYIYEFFLIDDQGELKQEYRFELDTINVNRYNLEKKK